MSVAENRPPADARVSNPRAGHPTRPGVASFLAVLLVVVGAWAPTPVARAATYPTLPVAESNRFVTDLSAPVLDPGSSGAVTFTLTNPVSTPMTGIEFTLEAYAFNAFPGNATGALPSGGVPTFSGGAPNGASDVIRIAQLGPGSTFRSPADIAIGVALPASAPAGTYAVRTELTFAAGGASYLLQSRGHFTSSQWANATLDVNGSPSLDLTRLGVSGIVPETAVEVRTNSLAPWLYGLLGASIILAGAGGYFAWRRVSASSSGARRPGPPHNARTAFGNSRTSDGD